VDPDPDPDPDPDLVLEKKSQSIGNQGFFLLFL
jgi:hypothetical protein